MPHRVSPNAHSTKIEPEIESKSKNMRTELCAREPPCVLFCFCGSDFAAHVDLAAVAKLAGAN